MIQCYLQCPVFYWFGTLTTSEVLQIVIGLCSFILAIVIFSQNRKIKTLTDVVEELKLHRDIFELHSKIQVKKYLAHAPALSLIGPAKRKAVTYRIAMNNSASKIIKVTPIVASKSVRPKFNKINVIMQIGEETEVTFDYDRHSQYKEGEQFKFSIALEDSIGDRFSQHLMLICKNDCNKSKYPGIDFNLLFDKVVLDRTEKF